MFDPVKHKSEGTYQSPMGKVKKMKQKITAALVLYQSPMGKVKL